MERGRFTLSVALAISILGCGGSKQETASAPPAKASAPEAPTAAQKGTSVEAFRMGRSIGPQGFAVDEGGPWGQGDPVNYTFGVRNLPAGAQIELIITAATDKKKVFDEKKSPDASGKVAFAAPDTRAWAADDYETQILMITGDATVTLGKHSFKMGASKRPAK